MPNEFSQHKTESENNEDTDRLELSLLEKEKLASFIGILSFIFLIISSDKAIQVILQNKKGIQQPSNGPSSSELGALSAVFGFITNIILGLVAFARLRELENNIKSGKSTTSITPNVHITVGFLLVVIGTAVVAEGAYEKVDEEAQITIL